MVKGFCLPMDYVLNDISFGNVILLGATLPSYESIKDGKNEKGKHGGEVINADDPNNRRKMAELLSRYQ